MKQSILKLEAVTTHDSANTYRAIIKTQHGRVIFLSLQMDHIKCTITECFYIDRNQNRTGENRYKSKPLKLKSFRFPADKLLLVIETELDKKFYGVEVIQSDYIDLPLDKYLEAKADGKDKKYRFLIMVGEGNYYDDLPGCLRTRLKNKLHRSIYIELAYYKDGKGVIKECYYYDREYKRQGIKITPPMLLSCFFPYNKEGILTLLNREICCDFTHMIVTGGIDLDSNKMPLCGSI